MPGTFVYDGSFEGLLCVLRLLRDGRRDPGRIMADRGELQESLLEETVFVRTDEGVAAEMCGEIRKRISPAALRRALYAFLSEEEGVEEHIRGYLDLGWKIGADVDARLGDEHVHAVHAMSRRTGREAHRMRGFLRFRLLEGGLYYAPMRPERDVLFLVARYFEARMKDHDWVIHDLSRERAALFREGELTFADLPGFDARLSGEEESCQDLWRRYFKDIAVSERLNPRQQKGCMPVKYWNMLVEKPSRYHS